MNEYIPEEKDRYECCRCGIVVRAKYIMYCNKCRDEAIAEYYDNENIVEKGD